MKVIGLGDDKFICEISWNEMYEITNANDNEYDSELDIRAGDEIDLSRLKRAAEWVRKLDNEHLDKVIKELQLTLVGVEKVKATATALNLFNRLADKEHE